MKKKEFKKEKAPAYDFSPSFFFHKRDFFAHSRLKLLYSSCCLYIPALNVVFISFNTDIHI